jgi:hypothetical protein
MRQLALSASGFYVGPRIGPQAKPSVTATRGYPGRPAKCRGERTRLTKAQRRSDIPSKHHGITGTCFTWPAGHQRAAPASRAAIGVRLVLVRQRLPTPEWASRAAALLRGRSVDSSENYCGARRADARWCAANCAISAIAPPVVVAIARWSVMSTAQSADYRTPGTAARSLRTVIVAPYPRTIAMGQFPWRYGDNRWTVWRIELNKYQRERVCGSCHSRHSRHCARLRPK